MISNYSSMSASNSEILSIIDALSSEKSVSKNVIIGAIEDAFTKIASNYYGNTEIVAKMDLKSGEMSFFQKKVVKQDAHGQFEISIVEARKDNPEAEEGSVIMISLPHLPTHHLPVKAMKNSIIERICSAEKQIEYDEYKKREGEIVTGIVKKASNISLIVSLAGKTEAILFREGLIKTDNYKPGDKIRAYIKEVKRSDKDCQVILSRTDNNFLAMLIAESVIEVQDRMIDIKAIARSCGFKAKVAVISNDGRLDAVGACIGVRGTRIKPIVDELRGEKIDIVYYDRDLVNFAKNAITPAHATYGTYNESNDSIELVIPDDQLKLAIGKGGINVRLASQLVGCNISVISESDKKKADQEIFNKNVEIMCNALDVEQPVGQFLVSSNIFEPSDLIEVGVEKLIKSGAFNEDIATELVERAKSYVKQQQEKIEEEFNKLNVDRSIMDLKSMTPEIAILLAKNNVRSVQDIADLSSDEFIEICGEKYCNVADAIVVDAKRIIYGVADSGGDNS